MGFFRALGCDGDCRNEPDPNLPYRNLAIGGLVAGALTAAIGIPLLATGARSLQRERLDLRMQASFGSQNGVTLVGRF
jgi:hypothetical protein